MQAQVQRSEATKIHREYKPKAFHPFDSVSSEFHEFLISLHKEFTPRQRFLAAKREGASACLPGGTTDDC